MSTMGKRPLTSGSEFKDIGKPKGGSGGGGDGGMDKSAKIKAGASIVAILVAIFFLAYYFGVFGESRPANIDPPLEQTMTPEEKEEIEEVKQEQLELIEDLQVAPVGS